VTVQVGETKYLFNVGKVKSWYHPDGGTAISLVNDGGENWLPWPPPHEPIQWREFVFCLEGATDEAIAAAKVCEAEFTYHR
jgi:hypothetical protein